MLKKRVIPVILLRNGLIVQSRGFKRYQNLGTPTAVVERLSSWKSDELIYIDISPSNSSYDLNRDDLNHPGLGSIVDIIKMVAQKCQMPLTFGGGIRTFEDVYNRLSNGADKVAINTMAIDQIDFVTEIAKSFGSQCVVVSIDAKRTDDGIVVYKGGKEPTNISPVALAKMIENAGAGEILINSIDQDGSGSGFDIELIESVASAVKIPVIALGGCGKWEDFAEVFKQTQASAVAAANIFHHSENSVYNAREYLYNNGYNVRKPLDLSNVSKNL